MEQNKIDITLFLDKRASGAVIATDGTQGTQNDSDYYINIPLFRTYKKFDDYVNIDKDKSTTQIDRQKFNPYFIELSFFETVKSTGITANTFSNTTYQIQEVIKDKAKFFNIKVNES